MSLDQEKYVELGGCRCPSCESDVHISGGECEIMEGGAFQEITCNECDATWTDQYTLTGYSDLEEGDNDESISG